MHVIIRQGSGEYYTSAVFGCYDEGEDGFKRPYFIVFNKEKTGLVRQPMFDPANAPYLDLMVLEFDNNLDNWNKDEHNFGEVDFLSKPGGERLREGEVLSPELLDRCRQLDDSITFSEYNVISTEKDIEKLMMIAGGFHDAKISQLDKNEDGSVRVLLEDVWGCSIEIFLDGDVSFCTDSVNPQLYSPYWLDSSLIMADGYFVFVDDECVSLEDIDDKYCWFKARSFAYRVIPN